MRGGYQCIIRIVERRSRDSAKIFEIIARVNRNRDLCRHDRTRMLKRRIYVRKGYESIREDLIFYIFCEWVEIRGRRMSGRQTTLGGRICICSFLITNICLLRPRRSKSNQSHYLYGLVVTAKLCKPVKEKYLSLLRLKWLHAHVNFSCVVLSYYHFSNFINQRLAVNQEARCSTGLVHCWSGLVARFTQISQSKGGAPGFDGSIPEI